MKFTRKSVISLLSTAVAIAGLIYIITQLFAYADVHGVETTMRDRHGFAVWIFFVLCFAQPILLPIPEAVTVVAGSAILGSSTAFFVAFGGTILGIATMFFLVRLGGMKLVRRFVKPDQLESYHRFVKKNENLIILLLFIIPVLPDEIVCVGAGVSGVSPRKFLLIASLSKLITSFTLAYSVLLAERLSMSPTEITLTLSIAAAIVFAAVYLFKRRNKRRETPAEPPNSTTFPG